MYIYLVYKQDMPHQFVYCYQLLRLTNIPKKVLTHFEREKEVIYIYIIYVLNLQSIHKLSVLNSLADYVVNSTSYILYIYTYITISVIGARAAVEAFDKHKF